MNSNILKIYEMYNSITRERHLYIAHETKGKIQFQQAANNTPFTKPGDWTLFERGEFNWPTGDIELLKEKKAVDTGIFERQIGDDLQAVIKKLMYEILQEKAIEEQKQILQKIEEQKQNN